MPQPCYHFKFILFVTGRGEEEHLPKLFSALSASGICSFVVGRRIEQLRPRSQTRAARVVGSGRRIPNRDFERIGAPARRYIEEDRCNRLIVIDDYENISEAEARQTFDRYRAALDIGLGEKRERSSVHFLVNMLEAYFFAHSDAANVGLDLATPIGGYDGDVETIRNPKSRLREVVSGYNEIDSAGLILEQLDLEFVLANPAYCSSLRTCVKWIVDQLRAYPDPPVFEALNFDERFHLQTGQLFELTASQ